MVKRINITIDDELLNRIDSYSKKLYLSRSGFLSLALTTYLVYCDNLPRSFAYSLKSTTASEEV